MRIAKVFSMFRDKVMNQLHLACKRGVMNESFLKWKELVNNQTTDVRQLDLKLS
jgi:hypothetical protein